MSDARPGSQTVFKNRLQKQNERSRKSGNERQQDQIQETLGKRKKRGGRLKIKRAAQLL